MSKKLYIKLLISDRGQWYFVVRGNNHQVTSTSEEYSSRAKALQTAKLYRMRIVSD